VSRKISFSGQTFVVPDDATDDEITQIAGGGSTPAPNAGLAPPAGGPKPSTILNAPEESGLETGPLHSHNPAENNSLTHGGESARFLARAAHSAGQALNPLEVIPSIYHAAVDKPQDSQQAMEEQAATPPNVPPALSRFVYRSVVKPTTNAIQDYAAGRVTPEAIYNNSPEALGGAAGTVLGAKAAESIPGAAEAARKSFLPTTEEAGQLFQPIDAAAKSIPVDTKGARAIAEEAQRYGDAGATVPPVIKKFLARTEPTPASFPSPAVPAEPMNYPEGRLFGQNASRLSATDRLAATPNMERLVGKFADALRTANRGAAEKVGMGAQYDEAMRTYAGAAGRAKMLANLGDVAKKAAIGAAGMEGLHRIISSATKK
jgi:hypothetical protein